MVVLQSGRSNRPLACFCSPARGGVGQLRMGAGEVALIGVGCEAIAKVMRRTLVRTSAPIQTLSRQGPVAGGRFVPNSGVGAKAGFEPVWGFSCQVVIFGLLPVLCSELEKPFFVPSPAIRFAERAEGVKGPKR